MGQGGLALVDAVCLISDRNEPLADAEDESLSSTPCTGLFQTVHKIVLERTVVHSSLVWLLEVSLQSIQRRNSLTVGGQARLQQYCAAPLGLGLAV